MKKKSAKNSKSSGSAKKRFQLERQDIIIIALVALGAFFALIQIGRANVRVSHSDWPLYTNEQGNFSFRYPPEWGAPEQRQFDFPERPDYFYAVFPEADLVSFGGSLDDYEHPGRITAPTDDPGFIRSNEGGFFTPGNNSEAREIPANQLAIVEGVNGAKCLYNLQPFTETYQTSFGIIRCNLVNPPYNGVNFVINDPEANNKELKLLYEVISTFKKTAQ